MYVIVVGGGKVGLNLARELIRKGQEVTLIEGERRAYLRIEQELEHAIQYGDGTELWVLERAGIQRADLVIAVTGDDEDNILICQVAKEKYLCERIIARCNNPRNLQHFKLLGIQPAVSATDLILNLIEHEVPGHGLVHLLDLPDEKLEIIEVEVTEGAPAAGRTVSDIDLPDGSLIISVLPRGKAGFVPKGDTVINPGDEVLVVLDPGPRAAHHRAVRAQRPRRLRVRSRFSRFPRAETSQLPVQVGDLDPVGLADLAQHPRRVADRHDAGRQVARHHRAGADDRVLADRHARADDDAAAEPDVVAERDRLGGLPAGAARAGVDRVRRGQQLHAAWRSGRRRRS